MIYLDSSAVLKLVRWEACTEELVAWLDKRRGTPLVSSCLVEVEVPRAIRRYDLSAFPAVSTAIGRLYRIEINAEVRSRATGYEEPLLDSLDALHLATAEMLERQTHELEAVVAYDRHLLAAASSRGLTAKGPGMQW